LSEWIQQAGRAPEGALLGQASGETASDISQGAAVLIQFALQLSAAAEYLGVLAS